MKLETLKLILMEIVAVVLYIAPQVGGFYLFTRKFSL